MSAGEGLAASGGPARRLGPLVAGGWLVAVFALSQVVGLAVIVGFGWSGHLRTVELFDNGALIAVSTAVACVPQVAALLFIAGRYPGGASRVLGLERPRSAAIFAAFIVGMMAFLIASDWIVHLSGRPILSEFQVRTFASATEAGTLALLAYWIGIAACAPAVEEMMFRGLAFAGCVPVLGILPTILLTDLAWTALHVQYDLAGMAEVFAAGILLSGARIVSGSLWLPMAMHALMNAWAVFETAIGAKWPW